MALGLFALPQAGAEEARRWILVEYRDPGAPPRFQGPFETSVVCDDVLAGQRLAAHQAVSRAAERVEGGRLAHQEAAAADRGRASAILARMMREPSVAARPARSHRNRFRRQTGTAPRHAARVQAPRSPVRAAPRQVGVAQQRGAARQAVRVVPQGPAPRQPAQRGLTSEREQRMIAAVFAFQPAAAGALETWEARMAEHLALAAAYRRLEESALCELR